LGDTEHMPTSATSRFMAVIVKRLSEIL